MDKEEKNLIRELKEGDETAFRNIYLKYHRELYTVAIKYLRNKELAEDAVHDIFVKLWDYRDKLDNSGSLSGFLFTALENHVLNMISSRRRKLEKKAKLSKEKNQEKRASDNIPPISEYQKLYQEAIEKLPQAQRKVFELRIKEGLTNKEVAELRKISVHTVKSHFYKASKFIREYVGEHVGNNTGT
jgi:RNA polymerase sigma-70 factor (ECF subfamily)